MSKLPPNYVRVVSRSWLKKHYRDKKPDGGYYWEPPLFPGDSDKWNGQPITVRGC